MNTKLFGQFLLEKGYIGRDDLLAVLREQRAVNRSLADLAVATGVLTLGEVETIRFQQLRRDEDFGSVAWALGLLDEAQVRELQSRQRAERRLLGEILVAFGLLAEESLYEALRLHSAERAHGDEALLRALEDSTFSRVAPTAASVLDRVFQRVVGQRLVMWAVPPEEALHPVHPVWSQEIVLNEERYLLAIQISTDHALVLGSAVLGSPVTELDDLGIDAVCEFVNIVTGHVCANLSRGEESATAQPPQALGVDAFQADADTGLVLRCGSDDVSFNYAIAAPHLSRAAPTQSL